MSDTQVVLHLLALLLIYALAAKLDAASGLPMDQPLARSALTRYVLPAWHLTAPPADAASAPTHAAQSFCAAC